MLSKIGSFIIIVALGGLALSFARPVGAAPDVIRTLQEDDQSVQIDSWVQLTDSSAHSGAFHATQLAGATASFRFEGASITWLTAKTVYGGMAKVTIDGVDKGTFDLYAATDQFQVPLTFSGLTNGLHTIQIEALGEKNPASDNPTVFVDGFVEGVRTYDDNVSSVQYDSWKGGFNPQASDSYFRSSSTQRASMQAFVNGTSFTLITTEGPKFGKARVWVDEVPHSVIDLYSPTKKWQAKKVISGLSTGSHTVRIEVRHTKNKSSKGYKVLIDAFQYDF